ncbi:MAG: GIY-YIG nuclease family protein [bacterium]|nr:GIY-YIG nuclease family protein [bacterium]
MTPGAYYVYVLWSESSARFYIGVTDNVVHRVAQHNEGLSKWTRDRGPWELVWQRFFPTLSAARRFENLLKRQKGGNAFFEYTALNKRKFRLAGS